MSVLLRMVLAAFPCTLLGVKVAELSGQSWLGLIVAVCVWVAASTISTAGEAQA